MEPEYVKTFEEWRSEIESVIFQAKDDGVIMYIADMYPAEIYMYRDVDSGEVQIMDFR